MSIRGVRDAFGSENGKYVQMLERELRDYEQRIAKLETQIAYLIQKAS